MRVNLSKKLSKLYSLSVLVALIATPPARGENSVPLLTNMSVMAINLDNQAARFEAEAARTENSEEKKGYRKKAQQCRATSSSLKHQGKISGFDGTEFLMLGLAAGAVLLGTAAVISASKEGKSSSPPAASGTNANDVQREAIRAKAEVESQAIKSTAEVAIQQQNRASAKRLKELDVLLSLGKAGASGQ